MKRLIVLIASLATLACGTMTLQRSCDIWSSTSDVAFSAATAYYEANKSTMDPADALKFQHFLEGWKMARETRAAVTPYVVRWVEFLNE